MGRLVVRARRLWGASGAGRSRGHVPRCARGLGAEHRPGAEPRIPECLRSVGC